MDLRGTEHSTGNGQLPWREVGTQVSQGTGTNEGQFALCCLGVNSQGAA